MSRKEPNPYALDVFFFLISNSACFSWDSPQLMDKIGYNKKHMVKVNEVSHYYIVIISKVILLSPHSVVAHSRYKRSSIKPGQISLTRRQPRV